MSFTEWRDLASDYYKEAVRLNQKIDSELRRALKIHMRVPVFIDNIAKQFSLAQELRIKKGKPPHDKIKLKDLVYQLTDVFITSIKLEAEKRVESDINKKLKEMEAKNLKDLEETSKGNISGDFKDILQDVSEVKESDVNGNKM